MTYDQFVSDIVKGVEALGAAIMVIGGLLALGDYALSMVRSGGVRENYRRLRRRLGQAILLGLEVLIVGDIVRTIIVDTTLESVAVLGDYRHYPHRAQFLAGGRDRRGLAVEPVAS